MSEKKHVKKVNDIREDIIRRLKAEKENLWEEVESIKEDIVEAKKAIEECRKRTAQINEILKEMRVE